MSKGHDGIFLLIILVIKVALIIFFHEIHLIIIVFIVFLLLGVGLLTFWVLIFLGMFSSWDDGGFEEWRMVTGHHLDHGVDFSFRHLFMIDDELIVLSWLWCRFVELIIMWWFDVGIEQMSEDDLVWIEVPVNEVG